MVGPESPSSRIESLDQFRGYTVLGMFFVNFVGGFIAIHPIFHHHNTYCSYADTIMPHFFFAVGFAYRLTFLRRAERDGPWAARMKALRRNLGLILLGAVYYGLDGGVHKWNEIGRIDISGLWTNTRESLEQTGEFLVKTFKRNFFQTLVHIGVTGIWLLPVIAARRWVLIAFACISGLLHVFLSYGFNAPDGQFWSNYIWVHSNPHGIDGGPLGFLTWTIPTVAGALAYDALATAPSTADPLRQAWKLAGKLMLWGAVLMGIGYGISCIQLEPKQIPPEWTNPNEKTDPKSRETVPSTNPIRVAWAEQPFKAPPTDKNGYALGPVNILRISQRAGSVSYLTFGAGLSLFLYAFFMIGTDVRRLEPDEPGRSSGLAMTTLGLAWVVALIGFLMLAALAAGLFFVIRGGAPDGFVRALVDDYVRGFDVETWTVLFVISAALIVTGLELGKLVHRSGTWFGSLCRTLGTNALAGYIIHGLVEHMMKPFVPKDSPLWYVLAMFGVFLFICYLFIRHLEKNKIYIRL